MLSDLREKGSSDAKVQELITPENYGKFKEISRPSATATIKGDLAVKAVMAQQGLSVPRDQVDEEVMTLQAQAVQRREKFKESEVRPRVEMQMEQDMVLDWLSAKAKINMVEPKGEEERIQEDLGASPEELAEKMRPIVEEEIKANAETE
jgi:FKBP-type peptidyl-prolyl cis-trans isomerase (trigger factor)